MKSARDLYAPYLRELRQRYPADEAVVRSALDAFDSIQQGTGINQHALQPIVEAASNSRKRVHEIAVDLLQRLAETQRKALDAVAIMAENPRSHVRFNAIVCVGKSAPREFQLRLLRQALRDKSSKVRWKAAYRALRLRIKELVPDLEEAVTVEKDARAKASIEFDLKLLRDGHILTPEPDGTFTVTVPTRRGISTRWLQRA